MRYSTGEPPFVLTDDAGESSRGYDPLTARRIVMTALGALLMLVTWEVLARTMPAIVLATPLRTAEALLRLSVTQRFWHHTTVTFARVFLGVGIGAAGGFIAGLAAGLNRDVKHLLEPFRWTLMSVPAVVIVVMAMLWFGLGSTMVVSMTALFLAPFVYVNVVNGLESVDEPLIRMARVYRFPPSMLLRHVYVPAITAHLASSLIVITGTGVRIVILAEVMGTTDGVGYALSINRANLDIPGLFAWVTVCVAIVGVIEYGIMKPLQERALKWKRGSP